MFQSSPVPKDGRYVAPVPLPTTSRLFQSSPVPKDGRYRTTSPGPEINCFGPGFREPVEHSSRCTGINMGGLIQVIEK